MIRSIALQGPVIGSIAHHGNQLGPAGSLSQKRMIRSAGGLEAGFGGIVGREHQLDPQLGGDDLDGGVEPHDCGDGPHHLPAEVEDRAGHR